ncbi:KfrB domain-containing protein [Sphingobium cloacae]|uniref:KfrB domain-containing protein n=1 Tax=Sphingobium cloacae TaxID=120107 RepID=A0A1E1F8E7_9SPHN|nr:hypothetical protein [Sphingobium cloacae]BAV66701.1 hypothetical protein SCLO_3000340 [Sphingobium cloacae]
MALEPIRITHPVDPDRAEVEQRVVCAAERDPEPFFVAYRQHAESFDGRYVCADLMKEIIPEYSASPIARGRYNNAVHNTAAVLASEQFRRTLADERDPTRRLALFVTGSPGSGKTSLIMSAGLPPDARVLYEGQLLDPSSRAKIAGALDRGLTVSIAAVLPRIEDAFENTLRRFERVGRGASIATMARIQDGTPAGLEAIHAEFGDRVEIEIHDIRDRTNPRSYDIRDGLKHWQEELSRGSTEQRLFDQLHRIRREGRGSDDFERQARGQPIAAREQGVAREPDGSGEAPGDEPRRTGEDRSPQLLRGLYAPTAAPKPAAEAPADDGTYTGPIVAVDAKTATQLVDGKQISHQLRFLTGSTADLAEGRNLTISYRGGIGKVTDPRKQTQGRTR